MKDKTCGDCELQDSIKCPKLTKKMPDNEPAHECFKPKRENEKSMRNISERYRA